MDQTNYTKQPRIIHLPPKPTTTGESRVYTATIGQINAARRRTALQKVRELIREFHFTLDEIERDGE